MSIYWVYIGLLGDMYPLLYFIFFAYDFIMFSLFAWATRRKLKKDQRFVHFLNVRVYDGKRDCVCAYTYIYFSSRLIPLSFFLALACTRWIFIKPFCKEPRVSRLTYTHTKSKRYTYSARFLIVTWCVFPCVDKKKKTFFDANFFFSFSGRIHTCVLIVMYILTRSQGNISSLTFYSINFSFYWMCMNIRRIKLCPLWSLSFLFLTK